MARLVKPGPTGLEVFKVSGGGKGAASGGKAEYAERIAKYVPAEVIAAYLTLLPIVLGGSDPDTHRRTILLAVIFGLGVLFTPAYLWRFRAQGNAKLYHFVISTLAFVIWAYSIPEGLFDDVGAYDKVIAPILLVVFTLVSGLFAPDQPANEPAPVPHPAPAG
jgi:hypothetical protein